MSGLIHERFLLQSDEAARLYFDYAADLPIIDFHTHLPPADIAIIGADRRWQNLSQVWLGGDHYKWRQMRANGVDERFCTGDASDREKFDAFAQVAPYLLRNPLYHWCHLELARYFGIDDLLLGPDTADEVWERTSAVFRKGLSARSQARVLSALRGFYKHLLGEREVRRDPTHLLEGPKLAKRLPAVMTRDEVLRLLAAPRGQKPNAVRDRAMLHTMYAAGLRVSELVRLELGDLHLEARFLNAFGKGSKRRLVPIGDLAIEALVAYLREVRPRWALRSGSAVPQVFLTARGTPLTRQAFWKSIKDYARQAEIQKPVAKPITKTSTSDKLSRMKTEQLEQRISDIEGRIKAIDASLSDGGVWRDHAKCDKLGKERTALVQELEPLEFEWMRRAEE